MANLATRDRILDEAMRLFGENGFKATTIVQIEAAAGLSPGAGGIYHHFSSKDELLAAGIDRHLQRLDALRDIRHVFDDVGDLRTQLTMTARYALAELDREAQLVRILASETRRHPQLLQDASQKLIGATLDGFADWLTAHSARELAAAEARALAELTLGGLISTRLLHGTLGLVSTVEDDLLVSTWVDLLAPALGA